jgi:acyl-coenzyme A synthetase/AMP-(fatty) acid ligase
MALAPLVRGFAAGKPFAYRGGQCLDAGRFLRDATRLAALLPGRRYLLNLCTDRYHFAVGFAAALLRGQINLLPPSEAPDLIERLVSRYPDVHCLADRETGFASVDTTLFPELGDAGTTPPVPRVPENQVAAIVFTSGSTGEPVPYRKTWGHMVRVAAAEIDILGLRKRGGMALVGTVPPQHVFGLETTVLMAMQGGFAMHARRPFYPADIRAAIASLPRPRALVTSPVHLRVLLADPEDLPPVDFLLCATAPLSPQLAARAEARFVAPLHEIYGCTESGGIAARRTVATAEWRAMKGVSLRADGVSTWVHGGHVETEILLADIIELHGKAKFLLHGRTADLVNIAGKRTSLAYLNYHLNSIDGVRDGAFFLPDSGGDETVTRLAAYVVAPALSREALMHALRQRVDAVFLPRPLHFVEALPRNEAGKLPRNALRQIAAGLARTEHDRP